MVSVLCDGPFFDGSWDHLRAARARLDASEKNVPLLAKEFIVDERQIGQARDCGADAVLLIARIVDRPRLAALAKASRAEGLEPVVEVIDEREVDAAIAVDARIIGVNARDLDTLEMDPERSACSPRSHETSQRFTCRGSATPAASRRWRAGRADAPTWRSADARRRSAADASRNGGCLARMRPRP